MILFYFLLFENIHSAIYSVINITFIFDILTKRRIPLTKISSLKGYNSLYFSNIYGLDCLFAVYSNNNLNRWGRIRKEDLLNVVEPSHTLGVLDKRFLRTPHYATLESNPMRKVQTEHQKKHI